MQGCTVSRVTRRYITLPIEIPVVTRKRAAPLVELPAKDRAIAPRRSRDVFTKATFEPEFSRKFYYVSRGWSLRRMTIDPRTRQSNFFKQLRLRRNYFLLETLYASALWNFRETFMDLKSCFFWSRILYITSRMVLMYYLWRFLWRSGARERETINAFFRGHDRTTMPSYNVQLREKKIFYTISIDVPLTEIRIVFAAGTWRDRVIGLLVKATYRQTRWLHRHFFGNLKISPT